MNPRGLIVVGVVAGLWMSAAGWLFGTGGKLTLWYLPTIGLSVIILHVILAKLVRKAQERGFRTSRSTLVSLIIGWFCAFGFGFTVPDNRDGQLASVMSALAGPETLEMSIGICNPFGIVAITLMIIAAGFAAHDARGPRAETDDDLTDEERAALMARPGG